MATQATIAITPGLGQLLDAVSIIIGPNTVVRETMVIADPTSATQLAGVTAGGALKVDASATTQPVSIVGTVPVSGTVSISGSVAVTGTFFQATQPVSIAAPVTVAQATAANLNATVVFPSAQHVIVDSGSITANIGTTNGLALDATLTGGTLKALPFDGTNTIFTSAHPGFIQGSVTVTSTTITGTVSVTQGTSPWVVSNGGTFAVQEATLDAALIAQEATTSGVKGLTAFGAVTTNAPTYTTAKSDALSLDTSGNLRVSLKDSPANTNSFLVTATIAASQTIAVTNTGTFAVQATLSAETTKVIGTVRILGNLGVALDAVLGATKPANVLQVGGNDGTNAFAIPLSSGGAAVQVNATIAASQTIAVTNTGTFAVQATLSAETTKVIGTIRITGNVGGVMDAVLGATKPANVLQVGGNDGTNAYAIPLASGGSSVVVSGTVTTSATGATTGNAPTAATVGVTNGQALAANASRKGLILVNTSSNFISIAFGANAAVLNSGVTLAPYGTYEMDSFNFTTAAVNAIASGAGSNLAIQEWQ